MTHRVDTPKMSFLDRIDACNAHDLSRFLPFRVAGSRLGWVKRPFAALLAANGRGTPPRGLLFPLPRGIGNARRCAGIAFTPPPAEETGKAILHTTEL